MANRYRHAIFAALTGEWTSACDFPDGSESAEQLIAKPGVHCEPHGIVVHGTVVTAKQLAVVGGIPWSLARRHLSARPILAAPLVHWDAENVYIIPPPDLLTADGRVHQTQLCHLEIYRRHSAGGR